MTMTPKLAFDKASARRCRAINSNQRALCCFVIWLLATMMKPAIAEPLRAAAFGFELYDTSYQVSSPSHNADQARLARLDAQLRDLLTSREHYILVDIESVAQAARAENFRTCGGCEVELAHRVGAQVSVIGWVQKVSNLILNINVEMRSVPDGKVVQAGSVDLRGDTDESWSRGLRYLFSESLRGTTP